MSKIKKHHLKKRYKAILQDRMHLTDYERDQLIPELRLRLGALIQYFSDIIRICENQKNSRLFIENLSSIINPKGLPSSEVDAQCLSEKFFDGVKKQAQIENVDDINRILNEYENIKNVGKLGLFLNEVNLLCSSLLEVKNRLFLFKIEAYPHILDQRTGQTITNIPHQFYLTTEPFQIAIQNIAFVCKATSETVHEWHRQTMNMKSQFLNLFNNKITLRNNRLILLIQILTIFLAITLSAFFLSANDPFNLIKKNQELKSSVKVFEDKNQLLRNQLVQLKKGENNNPSE